MNQNNAQRNFTLGSEVNLSPNPSNSLVLEFAKALVHQNGPAYAGFAVKYIYSRGKGFSTTVSQNGHKPDICKAGFHFRLIVWAYERLFFGARRATTTLCGLSR